MYTGATPSHFPEIRFDLADEGGNSLIDGGVGFPKLSLGVVHDQSSQLRRAECLGSVTGASPVSLIRFGSAYSVSAQTARCQHG